MNYPYTIEDLSRECNVSKQSIYNLIGKNKDFVKENSRKQQRKIKYNQEVLDWLLDYYGKNQLESSQNQSEPAQIDSTIAEIDKVDISIVKEKETKIEALEAEIEALKKTLEETEAERKELLKQNGALILTIQQQQQEHMILLPAATEKKGFFKRLFGK